MPKTRTTKNGMPFIITSLYPSHPLPLPFNLTTLTKNGVSFITPLYLSHHPLPLPFDLTNIINPRPIYAFELQLRYQLALNVVPP